MVTREPTVVFDYDANFSRGADDPALAESERTYAALQSGPETTDGDGDPATTPSCWTR